MNYINEINKFREYTSIDPLPAYSQALWFVLMHINNSCGWIEWFSASNLRLAKELCINEKTMRNQRDILVERGIILYESQRRKKNSGKYKLVSIVGILKKKGIETTVTDTVVLENDQETTVGDTVVLEKEHKTTVRDTVVLEKEHKTTVGDTVVYEKGHKTTVGDTVVLETTVRDTVVLVKKHKTTVPDTDITKRCCSINTTTTITNDSKLKMIVDFFNENFHSITPYETRKINSWLEEFPHDVLLSALEISVESGVRTMKYFEGILRNWLSKDLRTIDNINSAQVDFEKKGNPQNSKVINIKPNGFHNFNQREKYSNDELEKKLGIRK